MTAPVPGGGFSWVARSRVLVVLLAMMVIQLTLSAGVRVVGVHPDLMLLMAVSAGLVGGPERGALVGFAAGLLTDLFLQAPLGLSALSFTLVGYGAGLLRAGVVQASWWAVVGVTVLASAAGEVLYALTGAIVGQGQMLTDRLGPIAAVVAGLNGVAALLVVPVMRWAVHPEAVGRTRRSRRTRW